MRCRLLAAIAGGNSLTSLLSTVQAVMRRWRQPIGQDRERLFTRLTDSTSYPDTFMAVIMALTESPTVTDDRGVSAYRTLSR
jgi:hypothetical protein